MARNYSDDRIKASIKSFSKLFKMTLNKMYSIIVCGGGQRKNKDEGSMSLEYSAWNNSSKILLFKTP